MIVRIAIVAVFAMASIEWAARLRPTNFVDAVCILWTALVVSIALTADVLSAAHALGSANGWLYGGSICALIPVATRLPRASMVPILGRTLIKTSSIVARSPVLALATITLAVVSVANLSILVAVAPARQDVLAYHLPKMAYAIESGTFTLDYANYWAQQLHPHNGTALLIWTMVVSAGRDQLLPLWQFGAWWIAMIGVAGLARGLGARADAAVFAACVFGLLTNAIVVAADAGNDLILAAAAAICALMIVRDLSDDRPWRLPIAGLAAGAALGTKALFLITLISLGWLFAAARWNDLARLRRRIVIGLVALTGFVALALPSGYVQNYERWGNPFVGPADVQRKLTFAGHSIGYRLVNGTRNSVRYGVDSISADGWPRLPIVVRTYRLARVPLRWLTQWMNLESPDGTRASFSYDRLLSAHAAHAFWGILGVLMLWPSLVVGLVAGRGYERAFAIAGGLSFPLHGFAALYDPWHGRYFLTAAVFVVPIVGALRDRGAWRRYLSAALVIGCASGVTAAVLRSETQLINAGGHVSVLRMSRVEQLTREQPALEATLQQFDAAVPAAGTVQLTLPADCPEYLFFGDRLSRNVTPRPRGAAVTPRSWLVFREPLEHHHEGDVSIGSGFWLRRPASDFPARASESIPR